MTEAQLHREQLAAVLAWLRDEDNWDPEPEARDERWVWLKDSLAAFEDMQERGRYPLTEKQIGWVRKVAERCEIDLPEPPARARAERPRDLPDVQAGAAEAAREVVMGSRVRSLAEPEPVDAVAMMRRDHRDEGEA